MSYISGSYISYHCQASGPAKNGLLLGKIPLEWGRCDRADALDSDFPMKSREVTWRVPTNHILVFHSDMAAKVPSWFTHFKGSSPYTVDSYNYLNVSEVWTRFFEDGDTAADGWGKNISLNIMLCAGISAQQLLWCWKMSCYRCCVLQSWYNNHLGTDYIYTWFPYFWSHALTQETNWKIYGA